MTLPAGTRFGTFEVVSLLGAGGMGEVCRVRDARLNREVALKVIPATVAADPERMSRFTREAQALAALNHPNIAVIFGIEHADGATRWCSSSSRGRRLPSASHEAPPRAPAQLVLVENWIEELERRTSTQR